MSSSKIFTLKNNGSTPLDVLSAVIDPAQPAFSATPSQTLPHTLQGQEQMTVQVNASSEALGLVTSNLVITHTGINGPTISKPLSANFVPAPIGPGSIYVKKQNNVRAEIPQAPEYVFTNFTFEFLLYSITPPTPAQFGRYIESNNGAGIVINFQNTNRIAVEGSTAGIGIVSNDNAVIPNTWSRFTFRRQGSTMSILRDGVVIKSQACGTTPLNLFTSGTNFCIGVANSGEQVEFNMSDLRFWNVARSDAEILATYNTRLVGNETGLVMYYPLYEPDSVFEDRTENNVAFTLWNGIGTGPSSTIGYSANTPPWYT